MLLIQIFHITKHHMVCRPDVPRMEELIPILLQYGKSRQKPGGYVLYVAHNARAFDVPFLVNGIRFATISKFLRISAFSRHASSGRGRIKSYFRDITRSPLQKPHSAMDGRDRIIISSSEADLRPETSPFLPHCKTYLHLQTLTSAKKKK
ncbi:hypothetical protein NC652_012682 [Populus alba x Populus x berolinensis]|nr:hypothetical protein NC652_012682 [Populus alba x Populus x berolinensis]